MCVIPLCIIRLFCQPFLGSVSRSRDTLLGRKGEHSRRCSSAQPIKQSVSVCAPCFRSSRSCVSCVYAQQANYAAFPHVSPAAFLCVSLLQLPTLRHRGHISSQASRPNRTLYSGPWRRVNLSVCKIVFVTTRREGVRVPSLALTFTSVFPYNTTPLCRRSDRPSAYQRPTLDAESGQESGCIIWVRK